VRYDLHVHSNVSDGFHPPAEVVRRALAAGLDGIALTDPDSTAGLADARAEAGDRLDVLTGCEVSSRLGDVGVHMLAYFVDTENTEWCEALEYIRDDRVIRARKMVEQLIGLGVDITFERVRELAHGESIGRPHIAQALVESGVISTTVEAFTPQWIGDGGRAYVAKKVATPHETVELVTRAGGVCGVAHPIWVERESPNGWADARALITELKEAGLGALEVHHPDMHQDARARYGALANELDLVITSSSDWHGLPGHGGMIGDNTCGEGVIAALRARATNAEKEHA
jgi:3',5'-nucleoside bisphosphate phosphatase